MKLNTYIWLILVAVATAVAAEPVSYSVTFSTYALRALKTENLDYEMKHIDTCWDKAIHSTSVLQWHGSR